MSSNYGLNTSPPELNNFVIIKKLGEGSYSNVYKIHRKSDNQDYAMKKIKLGNLNAKEKENAVNEIRFLASLNSPYVVSYKESIFDESSNYLYIIMEYMSGGDVLQKIRTMKEKKKFIDEDTVWRYLISVTQGMKALHDMKILHRDLKCANIFLSADGKDAKIGDLNVSKVAKQGMLYTQTGTPYYASPEVWKDKPYNSKSDIWSLGCVMYEICAHRPPFMGKSMPELFKKISKGIYNPIPTFYSIHLSNVIDQCLCVNPNQRPSCDTILNNPYVKKMTEKIMHQSQVSQPSTDVTGSHSSGFDTKTNSSILLETIKVGKNMKNLGMKLPKQQYSQSKSPLKKRISQQQIQNKNLNQNQNQNINQSQIIPNNNSNIYNNQQQKKNFDISEMKLAVVRQNSKKKMSDKQININQMKQELIKIQNNPIFNNKRHNYSNQQQQVVHTEPNEKISDYSNQYYINQQHKRNNSIQIENQSQLPPISHQKNEQKPIMKNNSALLMKNYPTPSGKKKINHQLSAQSVQELDYYQINNDNNTDRVPSQNSIPQKRLSSKNSKVSQSINDLDIRPGAAYQLGNNKNQEINNIYNMKKKIDNQSYQDLYNKVYMQNSNKMNNNSNNGQSPTLPKIRQMSQGQLPQQAKIVSQNQ